MPSIDDALLQARTRPERLIKRQSLLLYAPRWALYFFILSGWTVFAMGVPSLAFGIVSVPYFIAAALILRDALAAFMTSFEFTSQRVIVKFGILVRETISMEMYRVQNVGLNQPIWLVPFDVGTITLVSQDETLPLVVLRGINEASPMREALTQIMLESRTNRGVAEFVAL